jgi:hypothetical protein
MIVYMKRTKHSDPRPWGVIQRWVARTGTKVGVGRTRIEAVRNLRPIDQLVTGSFDQRFLAAPAYKWTHRSEV